MKMVDICLDVVDQLAQVDFKVRGRETEKTSQRIFFSAFQRLLDWDWYVAVHHPTGVHVPYALLSVVFWWRREQAVYQIGLLECSKERGEPA